MIILIMKSEEDCTWIAFGKNVPEAKKELVKRWNSSPMREHMTAKELEDWYGFNIIDATAKGCEVW